MGTISLLVGHCRAHADTVGFGSPVVSVAIQRSAKVSAAAAASAACWVIPAGTGLPVPDTNASHTNRSASPASSSTHAICTSPVARAPLPAPADQGRERPSTVSPWRACPKLRQPSTGPRADRDHQGSLEPERHWHAAGKRLEHDEGRTLGVASTLAHRSPARKVEPGPGEVGPNRADVDCNDSSLRQRIIRFATVVAGAREPSSSRTNAAIPAVSAQLRASAV